MSNIVKTIVVAFVVLAPKLVVAQDATQDPRVAAAKTACAAGDVPQAIRLLAELYTASNDPIWIFNQGRCYHQNNQFPQAIARFKEFLRKNAGGPAEDSRDAQNYINEIEADMRRREPAPQQPVMVIAAPPGAPLMVQAQQQPADTSQEGRALRIGGVTFLAFGGACLAAGLVFSLLTQKAQSDVESKTKNGPVPYANVSSNFSDGHNYSTLQWVGYGIGAGSVITGGILYYLGARKAAAALNTSLVAPLVVAGGAGAIFQHAF